MSGLSHLEAAGRARMVDVSDKDVTARIARAEARLRCQVDTLSRVLEGRTPKGAVMQTAELAGVVWGQYRHLNHIRRDIAVALRSGGR